MGKEAVILNYDQMKEELLKPQLILLDVREKDELKSDGKIEQAKNVPVGEVAAALKLDDSEFKKKYGFDKPKVSDEIVVHCKAGIRAQTVAKSLTDGRWVHKC